MASFDAERFARWLKRYGETEGLVWTEVAQAAGLSDSTLYKLVNGSSPYERKKYAKPYEPAIEVMVNLAEALDLDLAFLLSKAGVMHADAHRMSKFTLRERELLYEMTGIAQTTLAPTFTPTDWDVLLRLCNELRNTLPSPPKETQI